LFATHPAGSLENQIFYCWNALHSHLHAFPNFIYKHPQGFISLFTIIPSVIKIIVTSMWYLLQLPSSPGDSSTSLTSVLG
jgi:hypothetical protein